MIPMFFLILFTLGMVVVIMPIVISIKYRKRLRLPSSRNRRRQNIEDMYRAAIKKENEKKSNYKIARKLKTAGYPFGMQILHYRIAQLCLPLLTAFLIIFLAELKNVINGYYTPIPFLPFVSFVGVSFFSPTLIIIYIASKRREVLAEEIVKFSHRLVVCITDKIPLYYAIRRAGRTCKVLKPYVDDLIIDWMDNPRAAINNFGDRVGINEVLPVTNTLLASWNAPADKIIDLFHQQIRNIDTMRDFQIKKKIEGSPLRVTFIIMIPFLCAGALVMLPWYRSFQEMIKQIF